MKATPKIYVKTFNIEINKEDAKGIQEILKVVAYYQAHKNEIAKYVYEADKMPSINCEGTRMVMELFDVIKELLENNDIQ